MIVRRAVGVAVTLGGWALAASAWGVHLALFPGFVAYAFLVAATMRSFDAYVQTMIETWAERKRQAELDVVERSTA